MRASVLAVLAFALAGPSGLAAAVEIVDLPPCTLDCVSPCPIYGCRRPVDVWVADQDADGVPEVARVEVYGRYAGEAWAEASTWRSDHLAPAWRAEAGAWQEAACIPFWWLGLYWTMSCASGAEAALGSL